jgi:hypothetical protein
MKTPTTATEWQHRIDDVIARLSRARSPHEAVAAASDLGFAAASRPPAACDLCALCGAETTLQTRWAEGQCADVFYCRDCGAFEEAA